MPTFFDRVNLDPVFEWTPILSRVDYALASQDGISYYIDYGVSTFQKKYFQPALQSMLNTVEFIIQFY